MTARKKRRKRHSAPLSVRPSLEASPVSVIEHRVGAALPADDASLRIEPPNGESGSAPAPADIPANPLGELAPDQTADAAPDVTAAAAAVTEETSEPAQTSGAGAHGAPNVTDAKRPAPAAGELPPGYEHWGERRLRGKKNMELRARVLELQKLVEARPYVAPTPEQAPASIDECEALLERVVPAVDELLIELVAPTLGTTAKDQALLVKTTAPVVHPHYAQLKSKLPWVPAAIGWLAIYAPKVVATVKAQQRQKNGDGSAGFGGDGTAAQPNDIVALRVTPYGGPRE